MVHVYIIPNKIHAILPINVDFVPFVGVYIFDNKCIFLTKKSGGGWINSIARNPPPPALTLPLSIELSWAELNEASLWDIPILHISLSYSLKQQHSVSFLYSRQTNECSSKPEFASGASYATIWFLYIQFIAQHVVFYPPKVDCPFWGCFHNFWKIYHATSQYYVPIMKRNPNFGVPIL